MCVYMYVYIYIYIFTLSGFPLVPAPLGVGEVELLPHQGLEARVVLLEELGEVRGVEEGATFRERLPDLGRPGVVRRPVADAVERRDEVLQAEVAVVREAAEDLLLIVLFNRKC